MEDKHRDCPRCSRRMNLGTYCTDCNVQWCTTCLSLVSNWAHQTNGYNATCTACAQRAADATRAALLEGGAQWEVTCRSFYLNNDGVCIIPEGWEPFGVLPEGDILCRRRLT